MEDSRAKPNTFQKGITQEEHYGTNPMDNTGVPQTGFKGIPVEQGRGVFGVEMPGTGPQKAIEPTVPRCGALTKKGEPCKAKPLRGDIVCYGHSRSDSSGDS